MSTYTQYVVSFSANKACVLFSWLSSTYKITGLVVAARSFAPVTMCMPFSNVCMAANAWETCLQNVAPKHEDYFPVVDCMAARGCVEVRSLIHGMYR